MTNQASQQTAEPTGQIYEGTDAEERLQQLGLTVDLLHNALKAGDNASRQATEFHPVTAAGLLRWLDTIESLRRNLTDEGWESIDVRNAPRIVSPDGTTILTVAGGNQAVGHPELELQFARERGGTTIRAVEINFYLQDELPFPPLADMSGEKNPAGSTWFLMYHRSSTTDELFSELARPTHMTEGGLAKQWGERIILPTIDFGGVHILPSLTDEEAGIDFNVEAI